MKFEQDFVMRTIKDMVRVIAQILLGKKEVIYELPEENEFTEIDLLYRRLIDMVSVGEINEAENLLLQELAKKDATYLEMALAFYSYLNQYEEEFLEANNYSREEIQEGIEVLARQYGVGEVINCLS